MSNTPTHQLNDTKDWTWVTTTRCPDCGFNPSDITTDNLPHHITGSVTTWPTLLQRPNAAHRPNAHTWSTLEYAGHLNDVFDVMDKRLTLILTTDHPTFPNWDQDEAATTGAYHLNNPVTLASALTTKADHAAARYAQLSASQHARTGQRSDGAEFTATTLGLYLLHELVHHLWDVTRY